MLTNAPISFGVIPNDHWFQPDWIDEDRAREGRDRLVRQNIIYGGQSNLLCHVHRAGAQRTGISRQCIVSALIFTMSGLINHSTRYRNMCRFNSGVRIQLRTVGHFVDLVLRSTFFDTSYFNPTSGIGE